MPTTPSDTAPVERLPLRLVNYNISPLRLLIFGRPLESERHDEQKLSVLLALPVFSSDAISSVAYATQQILLALGAAGLWTAAHQGEYNRLSLGITGAIVALLIIVVLSYRQTIFAYPNGGGSYIVSKDNLGTSAGLVAGAALLIDYILTVAVSIASGVQNLLSTPIFQPYAGHIVGVCILFVILLTLANLRGLKESSTLFAFPTYLFIFMSFLTIFLGLVGPTWFHWDLHREFVNQEIPSQMPSTAPLAAVGVMLVLKAFANGCSAMTGVEAVSNGVQAFRKPEDHNAAKTLVLMAIILGALFAGISLLCADFHVVYWESGADTSAPVIDQLSGAVFGKTGHPVRVALYYIMQFSTTLILVLAANTSYADFPRLSSIMARDGLLPRQLSQIGDRLVFSNGIVLLGAFSIALLAAFHGKVDDLIPLYAIGVFTAFTLSQAGMVRHWIKDRTPGWHGRSLMNGLGAIATGIVLLDIVMEKGPEGAWFVLVLMAMLVVMFGAIKQHYDFLRQHLKLENYEPDATPLANSVLLLVPRLNAGVMNAIEYGRTLSKDCRAIHVDMNPDDAGKMHADWEKYVPDIPLVILPSPYRFLIGPLLSYVKKVQGERPDHIVTVVVPEFVPSRWYHWLLHQNLGLQIKFYLLNQPGIIVTNVRYFVEGHPYPATPTEEAAHSKRNNLKRNNPRNAPHDDDLPHCPT